ncbi:MAG: glycosyltransferase, partial [bacterium]|nr:glycosyltransferase [bacterium]
SVIMMADLQEPPELIPKFISKWENGYEIVYGIVKRRTKTGMLRKIEIFLFYKLIGLLSNNMIIENASDFRLIDLKVKDIIVSMPEHNKIFRGITIWTGFTHAGIPFNRPQRFAGKSKAYFRTVLTVATNALFGFSSFPKYLLWLFFIILLTIFLFSMFIGTDNTSMLSAILLLGFMLIIQNEYFIRILDETRNRPQFIVKNKYGL